MMMMMKYSSIRSFLARRAHAQCFLMFPVSSTIPFSYYFIRGTIKKNLAASSMLHEAKIAYYALDVMYTHQTRIAYTKRTH